MTRLLWKLIHKVNTYKIYTYNTLNEKILLSANKITYVMTVYDKYLEKWLFTTRKND